MAGPPKPTSHPEMTDPLTLKTNRVKLSQSSACQDMTSKARSR